MWMAHTSLSAILEHTQSQDITAWGCSFPGKLENPLHTLVPNTPGRHLQHPLESGPGPKRMVAKPPASTGCQDSLGDLQVPFQSVPSVTARTHSA